MRSPLIPFPGGLRDTRWSDGQGGVTVSIRLGRCKYVLVHFVSICTNSKLFLGDCSMLKIFFLNLFLVPLPPEKSLRETSFLFFRRLGKSGIVVD